MNGNPKSPTGADFAAQRVAKSIASCADDFMSWEEDLKRRLDGFPPPEIPSHRRGLTAVLVPIGWNTETERDEILLMKRSSRVESHKSQVSFPGGYHETGDLDLLHTALREATEEVGLAAEDVRLIGRLQPVTTRNEVVIYPWVGRIPLPYPFVPSEDEVERLIFLPLARLLEEGLQSVSVPIPEYRLSVRSPGIEVDGELVWGATARMLEELCEHMRAVFLASKE